MNFRNNSEKPSALFNARKQRILEAIHVLSLLRFISLVQIINPVLNLFWTVHNEWQQQLASFHREWHTHFQKSEVKSFILTIFFRIKSLPFWYFCIYLSSLTFAAVVQITLCICKSHIQVSLNNTLR